MDEFDEEVMNLDFTFREEDDGFSAKIKMKSNKGVCELIAKAWEEEDGTIKMNMRLKGDEWCKSIADKLEEKLTENLEMYMKKERKF